MHPARTVKNAVTPRPVKQVSRAAYTVRHPVGAAENKAIGAALSAGTGHRRTQQRKTATTGSRQRKVRNLTPRQRKTRRTFNSIALAVIAVCVIVIIATALSGGGSSNKPVAQTPMQKCVASIKAQPASQVIGDTPGCMKLTVSERLAAIKAATTQARPVAASKPAFPPRTLAAFRAFAATGDARKVYEIGKSTKGLPSCPEPNIYVTVSRALTGRALEADLSAFFAQSGLIHSHCQAFVFAFHSRRDYRAHRDDGYTAGRVALTTNAGSGPPYNLEVDAGDVYNFPAQFDFNF
jgi:hypothetical protein